MAEDGKVKFETTQSKENLLRSSIPSVAFLVAAAAAACVRDPLPLPNTYCNPWVSLKIGYNTPKSEWFIIFPIEIAVH
jgi:hypothetical protein